MNLLHTYKPRTQAIPEDELKQRAHGVDGMLVLLTDKVSSDLIQAAGTHSLSLFLTIKTLACACCDACARF
jgi:lactate dehydrogenase-like 2-hydroxyacid dehydrogenase